jgi:hypothetical protein
MIFRATDTFFLLITLRTRLLSVYNIFQHLQWIHVVRKKETVCTNLIFFAKDHSTLNLFGIIIHRLSPVGNESYNCW